MASLTKYLANFTHKSKQSGAKWWWISRLARMRKQQQQNNQSDLHRNAASQSPLHGNQLHQWVASMEVGGIRSQARCNDKTHRAGILVPTMRKYTVSHPTPSSPFSSPASQLSSLARRCEKARGHAQVRWHTCQDADAFCLTRITFLISWLYVWMGSKGGNQGVSSGFECFKCTLLARHLFLRTRGYGGCHFVSVFIALSVSPDVPWLTWQRRGARLKHWFKDTPACLPPHLSLSLSYSVPHKHSHTCTDHLSHSKARQLW